MKRILVTLLLAAGLRYEVQVSAYAQDLHYAPEENLDRIDVTLIENAADNIDMAAYVLTDWAFINALNDAEARGVKVRIVLDPREHSDVARFVGLDVRQKRSGPLMRIKAFEVTANSSALAAKTSRMQHRNRTMTCW